jgi:hypothetical protein
LEPFLSIQSIVANSNFPADAQWFQDLEEPAILLTWIRSGEQWVKVVIRLDRKVGRSVANIMVTAGIVQRTDIGGVSRYHKL